MPNGKCFVMREYATNMDGYEDVINNKISVMIEALKSDDPRIVSESIKTLGALGGSRELEALLSVISSNEYLVHHADAINQIHNITAPRESAIAPLIDCAVGGSWPEIRNGAYSAISAIGGKEAFEALKGALYTDESTTRGYRRMYSVSAILDLSGTYRDSLVEIFLSTIRAPIMTEGSIGPYDRLNKVREMQRLKPISSRGSIETSEDYISARFLWLRDYRIRNEACRAMRELGENKKLVAECYALLQNQNASVRHTAAYCLGHVISDARTVKKLEEIWREDDNQIVRNCAVLSLVEIANDNWPNSLGTLEEVRRMAVRAILNLEEIGINWLRILNQDGGDEWTKVEIDKFLGTNWSGKNPQPPWKPPEE